METAVSIIKTEVAMTQTATPTIYISPPTMIPPTSTTIPFEDYETRLNYAISAAEKIRSLYPYYTESLPIGNYRGCAQNNNFINWVRYTVYLPMEDIRFAFEKYLQSEKWEFTEATPGFVNEQLPTVPTRTYDAYRITLEEKHTFERLIVTLQDFSFPHGEHYVDVVAEITHLETRDYMCPPYNGSWVWDSLQK